MSGPGEHPDGLDVAARPYLLTGGRTRPRQGGVAIETVVLRGPEALARTAVRQSFERARILQVLDRPLSVAELAAILGLPLTVVLVLVGDLVAEGYLVASESSAELRDDLPFLERLISGVAAL